MLNKTCLCFMNINIYSAIFRCSHYLAMIPSRYRSKKKRQTRLPFLRYSLRHVPVMSASGITPKIRHVLPLPLLRDLFEFLNLYGTVFLIETDSVCINRLYGFVGHKPVCIFGFYYLLYRFFRYRNSVIQFP